MSEASNDETPERPQGDFDPAILGIAAVCAVLIIAILMWLLASRDDFEEKYARERRDDRRTSGSPR